MYFQLTYISFPSYVQNLPVINFKYLSNFTEISKEYLPKGWAGKKGLCIGLKFKILVYNPVVHKSYLWKLQTSGTMNKSFTGFSNTNPRIWKI